MELRYGTFDSPVGPLTFGATANGLAVLHLRDNMLEEYARKFDRFIHDPSAVEPFNEALAAYWTTGDLPTMQLDLRGTPFQLRCWEYLCGIPKGETRSYLQMARAVSSEKALRAVGAANGANPVAIIVPCHRVIASDGTLHGYGGGLAMKQRLLEIEGVRLGATQHALAFHAR